MKVNSPTTNGCPISPAKPWAMPSWKSCETGRIVKLTVYCGHTHSSGICEPLPNVTIYTGAAKYGVPVVQKVIELPD